MKFNFKQASAILFQFALLSILTWCLYSEVGDPDTIIGAMIGLAVGIGINTITE